VRPPLPWLAALLVAIPTFARADRAGCLDHPLFPTRMPGYALESCKVEEYGAHQLLTTRGPKVPVEGKVTSLGYAFTGPRASEPSGLAVVRNYQSAMEKVGGAVLQRDPDRWVNGRIARDGQEAWAQVEKGNGKIWLVVVEKHGMAQYVVADAAALADSLKATGHVAVHGIFFDTGKAEVRPDSEPALQEIARLMEQNPGFRFKVVGHTDMAGSLEQNLRLSEARAGAVVQALVTQHRVAPLRLQGHGVGPLSPVATNDTEEGRARNRRVELVKE
jgi:OOP family OmpA-OmpF porin